MTARVIVTRPEPDAAPFADLCRVHGLEPVLSPVMTIEIEKAAVDLSGVGALAFTSANGVRAFAANSGVRDLPVFAVGKVTGEAAQAAGFADVRAAGGDMKSLANRIASENAMAALCLLHIAGEDRAGDLVAILAERGISARRRTLYRAVPAAGLSDAAVAALKAEGGDLWVSLFSPRSARLFVALAERAGLRTALGCARVACLSAAVADAAGPDWADAGIAPERTAESLVAVIAASERA